jgi:hypothetical protein
MTTWSGVRYFSIPTRDCSCHFFGALLGVDPGTIDAVLSILPNYGVYIIQSIYDEEPAPELAIYHQAEVLVDRTPARSQRLRR